MTTTRPHPCRPVARRIGWGFFLGALLLGAVSGGAAAPWMPPKKIRVVLDDNYPPYIFRNAEGGLQGILVDQWALWENKTGVPVDLMAMDWGEAQTVMHAGGADVIDTIFRNEEREQLFDFTEPYAQIQVPVYAHESLGGIVDVPSLRGFTIGVKAGDAVVGHLTNRGITSLTEYPSYEDIIQAAREQKIKVFSVDQPAAIYYLYKYGVADQFRQSFLIYTGQFHRAVSKNHPELLALVQDGFDRISQQEYQAIEQKWMGTPFLFRTAIREWAPWLLLAVSIVLLLIILSVLLRRQVRVRTKELKEALAELQRGQGRIQNIVQLAPVGIGVIQDRIIRETNHILCEMTGYTHEEMLGQTTRLFYETKQEYERVGSQFYSQIAQRGFASLEVHGQKKNGHQVIWILSGAPTDPADKEGATIFTAMDITERKKTEEELRISRAYFASVVNSINEAILVQDADSPAILDVNDRMCEMYGYTREEALTVGLGALCPGVPPYSLAEAAEWTRKAREEGPQMFEWLAQHRDGHLFWVEVNIRKVKLGDKDRLVVTARNISDRKIAEEERIKFERRIQEAQKLESLGLMAGGIAHDFNNLLAAILGNIDLALLEIPESSSAYEDIQSAIVATKRASELVQQMLAYAGKGQFRIESVDVQTIMQETTHMLQASISKNAQLDYQFPGNLAPIHADATQLRQVIMNLVINASEALEGRSGTLRLSAGAMDATDLESRHVWPHEPLPPGSYVYIEVSDTGAGIRPEVLEKIFDPFFSTKFTGRGLGLAAVLGIVRSHKGAIQVNSTPGKGTTIRVLFPAKLAGRVHPSSPAVSPPLELPRGEGKLIMLVDDEPSLLETGTKLLDRLGYRVICATDGEHAVHLFHAQSSELSGIILDLSMPGMDGVETLAQLRRIRPDIPVLVSSGHGEQDVRMRFQDQDLNGFISKPYSLEGLQRALASSLPA